MFKFYLFIFVIISGKDLFISCKEANVYWREYFQTVPKDAIPTGYGTYIGQMTLENGGVVPGTLYPDRNVVISEMHTRMVQSKHNIKVLCSPEPQSLKWEYVNTNRVQGKFLENCVRGGFELGMYVYIGKVFHEGEWRVGKVFPANTEYPGLRIWSNNGNLHSTQDFQILMVA